MRHSLGTRFLAASLARQILWDAALSRAARISAVREARCPEPESESQPPATSGTKPASKTSTKCRFMRFFHSITIQARRSRTRRWALVARQSFHLRRRDSSTRARCAGKLRARQWLFGGRPDQSRSRQVRFAAIVQNAAIHSPQEASGFSFIRDSILRSFVLMSAEVNGLIR